jgi:hypothetical protein
MKAVFSHHALYYLFSTVQRYQIQLCVRQHLFCNKGLCVFPLFCSVFYVGLCCFVNTFLSLDVLFLFIDNNYLSMLFRNLKFGRMFPATSDLFTYNMCNF